MDNTTTFYEFDLNADHGVSLAVEPSTMQRRGASVAVTVDGRTCAAYLGPRDRKRLAELLAGDSA